MPLALYLTGRKLHGAKDSDPPSDSVQRSDTLLRETTAALERTHEIKGYVISLVRSTGYPIATDRIFAPSPKVDRSL